MKLIECVPNFSEGRDPNILDAIAQSIRAVQGVRLLNVDPGAATNRTVFTFVGEPDAVCQAAFDAVKTASKLIDMRHHHGTHPRMGATDVLPLIPISEVTLDECAELARKLACRIAQELEIPTYNYEAAASCAERQNLAAVRSGEYEGLAKKLVDPKWRPDFGKAEFTEQAARSGATIVGARDFLVAVNFNLNTTSSRRANAVAFDVREKGRNIDPAQWSNQDGYWSRHTFTPTTVSVNIAGALKGCKAIGWFIREYGIAQVSMNITNISQTALHTAFEEVSRAAALRGMRVTGTEIVGLVPLKVFTSAGEYFLTKQQRSIGVSDDELVQIASRSMGLSDLSPFDARLKVIEYLMDDGSTKRLVDLTCKEFAIETASESPAPGGGSIAAYMGALGAALGVMVANLSSHKASWESRWNEFSATAQKGQRLVKELLELVDQDTAAFNKIMDSLAMPKSSPEQKAARSAALQAATLYATQVPLRTMEASIKVFEIVQMMAEHGNPNSVSDAGVGALAARSAVLGAFLNVRINAGSLKDRDMAAQLVNRATEIARQAQCQEDHIMDIVNSKINNPQ